MLRMPSNHWEGDFSPAVAEGRHWPCLPTKSLTILPFGKSIWRFWSKTMFANQRNCHSSSNFRILNSYGVLFLITPLLRNFRLIKATARNHCKISTNCHKMSTLRKGTMKPKESDHYVSLNI